MIGIEKWIKSKINHLEQRAAYTQAELNMTATDEGHPTHGSQSLAAAKTMRDLRGQLEDLDYRIQTWQHAAAPMATEREQYARKVLAYVNALVMPPLQLPDNCVYVPPVVYTDITRLIGAGEVTSVHDFEPIDHMDLDGVITDFGLTCLPHADLTPEQATVYQDLREAGKSIEEATVSALEFTSYFTQQATGETVTEAEREPAKETKRRRSEPRPHGLGVR